MKDCKCVISELEGEENLISAVQLIVNELGSSYSNKNLSEYARKILLDLGSKLTNLTIQNQSKFSGNSEIQNSLNSIQERIMGWEADQSSIWESGPNEGFDYLTTINEARKLTHHLESLHLNKGDERFELLRTAHDVLQTAMARLEEEFQHMLVQNKQSFEPQRTSFNSNEGDHLFDEGSIIAYGDNSVDNLQRRDSVGKGGEEFVVHMISPEVVSKLRGIADTMFDSGYDMECIRVYTNLRREALDECLVEQEMEKLSIEDVLKMDWASLNSKIRRWNQLTKIFVRVYLASEKSLCDQIFGTLEPSNLTCFVEASKSSLLQLLNFGEAMSIGPHRPEKLPRILDMYEVLADLLPSIDGLYPEDIGSSVRNEYHEVLQRLGESVRETFIQFKKAVATNTSPNSLAGGGTHHLTRYVMNYLMVLTDYSKSLNLLLQEAHKSEDYAPPISDMNLTKHEESKSSDFSSSGEDSPMAHHFRSVASILENNLDEKSKLYRDTALQHLFLMNNVHYMAQKVKGSELRVIFGDEWIRKHNWKFQQQARNYERAGWSSVLLFLRDDGIHNSGSSSGLKNAIREKLRSFYQAFEEIYRTQTTWVIPDLQLREELRISTSFKVIQGYRSFVGRHANHISDRIIKYSAEDLEKFFLDLFEGSPKLWQNTSKK